MLWTKTDGGERNHFLQIQPVLGWVGVGPFWFRFSFWSTLHFVDHTKGLATPSACANLRPRLILHLVISIVVTTPRTRIHRGMWCRPLIGARFGRCKNNRERGRDFGVARPWPPSSKRTSRGVWQNGAQQFLAKSYCMCKVVVGSFLPNESHASTSTWDTCFAETSTWTEICVIISVLDNNDGT